MPTDHRQAAAAAAVALVVGGLSLSKASDQVAAEHDVTGRTVRRWITNAGLKLPELGSNFADFNDRRRQEVGNRMVAILERRLSQLEESDKISGRELKDLAVAFGVLTDKRRLEDGLATDRTETSEVPAREILRDKVDELAERRLKRDS